MYYKRQGKPATMRMNLILNEGINVVSHELFKLIRNRAEENHWKVQIERLESKSLKTFWRGLMTHGQIQTDFIQWIHWMQILLHQSPWCANLLQCLSKNRFLEVWMKFLENGPHCVIFLLFYTVIMWCPFIYKQLEAWTLYYENINYVNTVHALLLFLK